MQHKTLRLHIDAVGLATVVIDVPDRSVNVLTAELIQDLADIIEKITRTHEIRGAILTSGKTTGFLAGGDLTDLARVSESGLTARAASTVSHDISVLFRRLETSGKPIAAVINGLALGGGLELCLACHHRILIDDPAAVLGFPEVTVGLLPGAGGTQRLPRLIGIPDSLTLLLKGKNVAPSQALALGLVHEVAPSAELMERAHRWLLAYPSAVQPWDAKGFTIRGGVGPLAEHAGISFTAGTALVMADTCGNYPAPLAILSCVFEGTQVDIDVGLRIESKYFGELLAGPVARNLMRTLFIGKGNAEKAARRRGLTSSEPIRIGVVGVGRLRTAIAVMNAKAGLEVVVLESPMDQVGTARDQIVSFLSDEIGNGNVSQRQADESLLRVKSTREYADFRNVHIVIECGTEQSTVKMDVIRAVDRVIPANAVILANSPTAPLSELAQATSRPENFIGLNLPVRTAMTALVEIIPGANTSEDTIARVVDYVRQLKKTSIFVGDCPGFFVDRLVRVFLQEGHVLLTQGVAPALIENAARLAGFASGPLELSDRYTLSLQRHVLKEQEHADLSGRLRLGAARTLIDQVVDDLKRSGRGLGGGFYDYPGSGQKHLWPGLRAAFPQAARQPAVEDLKLRFLTVMAVEAVHCLEDGIVTSPGDADLGSVLGAGYPGWTGGTMSYIDAVGASTFVDNCRRLADDEGFRFNPPM